MVLAGIAAILAGALHLAPPAVVPGWALLALGVVLIQAGLAFTTLSMYRPAAANQALVRTGMGGARVVLNDGIVVFPSVHQVVPVSLETVEVEVACSDRDALITRDSLRVDVSARFLVRVGPTEEEILLASRSLGHEPVEAQRVQRLVSEKLVAALRSATRMYDLRALLSASTSFETLVGEMAVDELRQNGLRVELAALSRLSRSEPPALSGEELTAQLQRLAVEERTEHQ